MSSFTALNGASPKLAEPPALTVDKSPAQEDHPLKPPLTKPPSAQHETATQPSTSSSSSMQREAWAPPITDRSALHSADFRDAISAHKRKRSGSVEHRDRPAVDRSPGNRSDSRDHYSTPQRDYRPYGDDHRSRDRDKDPWYSHQSRGEDSYPFESSQKAAVTPTPNSDEQIGDVLRRATSQLDHGEYGTTSPDGDDRSIQMYGGSYTPDARQDSILQYDPKKRKRNFSNRTKTGCLTCRKRKKKCDESKPECGNCVRGRFLCAGYPPQRGPGWPKPDSKSATVPLESKDPTYVPPGAYGMPQPPAPTSQTSQTSQPPQAPPPPPPPLPPQLPQSPSQPGQQTQPATAGPSSSSYVPPQPAKRESISHYRGQALRIDPPQGRPLAASTDDDRPTASTMPSASVMSPDKLTAMPFTPANAFPTPVSANTQATPFAERMAKEYAKDFQRVPTLHDLSRTAEPETPHPATTPSATSTGTSTSTTSTTTATNTTQLPQINILRPTRTNSPSSRTQPPSSNPQVTAQLALSHSQYPTRRTQKEEMLSGRHFYPFDKELCLERERCATACWRFNNLTAPPTHGVSPEERARLFLEILQPRDPVKISPSEASPVTNVGRVGRHVAVETPFACDYGYNISIGNHVVIGRNCTINDVCEVKIGDNCVIGPNVSIFSASLPMDPNKRQGGQGPQFGKSVTIEADCFIGGGAIILPGRTIGKGSTVGAGSVVTKDVPPFTIVAGNPARVLRGIAS